MSGQSQNNMLPNQGTESGGHSNNNLYQSKAETTFSGDNIANGFGIAKPASLKTPFETFPGSEASEQYKLKMREIDRFNALSSAGGFDRTAPITNAGQVITGMVSTGYGENGAKPDVQHDALK